MRRIFHIVSNKEWGGGEQYVYDLCQRQKADGMEVGVFCRNIGGIVKKYKEITEHVYPLYLNGTTDFVSAWRMAHIVRKAGGSIIHAHNFKDAFTACYARRIIADRSVRVVMCRHLTRTGKNSLHYRWLYRQLDALCFDSELSKSVFLSTNPDIDERKLRVIHTSIVVPQKVQNIDVRQEFNICKDDVLAMYHGRLNPEKGLDTLIEATSQIRDHSFRLILIGQGDDDYTRHLENLIGQYRLEDKVVLAGFRHPVIPYTSKADFGILPSIVREGCPLSPQEYMSQGCPVIATDNGGQKEYISNGVNGLLVPPDDSVSLAKAMMALIEKGDWRRNLGQNAKRDFFDHMDYEHFYQEIKHLYE